MFGWESLGVSIESGTETSVKILVCSLLSDDITLNGVTQTPAAVGTDRGSNDAGGVTAAGDIIAPSQTAGYTTIFTLTGLVAGTAYNYTVTQSSAIVTDKFTMIRPAGVDSSIFFSSCNRAGDHSDPTGMYGYVNHYSDNGNYPVSACVEVDDNLYADQVILDDTQAGFTGKSSTGTPTATGKEYDYALVYLAEFGLLGDSYQTTLGTNNFSIINGHSASRKKYHRTKVKIRQWGDHIFNDDIGYDNVAKLSGSWDPGKNVWDAFYGGGMPPLMAATSNHTEAQHFGVTIGDLYIGSLDGITMGEGDAVSDGTLYGDTQIDEMIAGFAAATTPFSALFTHNGIRCLHATLETIDYGSSNPTATTLITEHARLFTAPGALQSIWDASQGLVFCGDYHNGYVYRHEETVLAVVDESFVEVACGTVNGSQNHLLDGSITVGVTINNATALYVDPTRSNTTYDFSIVRIDLLGSESPKRLVVNLIDKNWNTVWSGTWTEGQAGNLPT